MNSEADMTCNDDNDCAKYRASVLFWCVPHVVFSVPDSVVTGCMCCHVAVVFAGK